MISRRMIATLFMAVSSMALALAQVEVHTEAQASAAGGDHMPLWLQANKQGLSTLETLGGYVRAGVFRSAATDSMRRWEWGFGADVAVAGGFTSTLVVQQAYADLRWLHGRLTVGSKEQPMQLKNRYLSTGSQTLGENARPLPGIRLELPDYWTIPYTRGWLGLKGHIFYGMQTDDQWQKDFTLRQTKYTEHTKLHTKAGYLRIGRDDHALSAELGLEMACQYGGRSYGVYDELLDQLVAIENEDGLKGMLRALIPGGGEVVETTYKNTGGNHLGSWVARVNYDCPSWGVSVYADHFFEDHSSMLFLGNSGYGEGDHWTERDHSHVFLYDLKDIMLGAELRLKDWRWVSNVVVEYLYTKYQSGPVYHDHTRTLSDQLGGRDNYYNHSIFPGWQHWGQVLGNPLYRSPIYNDDHEIYIDNSRFWAWHLGVSGTPLPQLRYRLLATWQRGWGTYYKPLLDPAHNLSVLLEAEYRLNKGGWSLKGAFGLDHGRLLGNNVGGQLTVAKHFKLRQK